MELLLFHLKLSLCRVYDFLRDFVRYCSVSVRKKMKLSFFFVSSMNLIFFSVWFFGAENISWLLTKCLLRLITQIQIQTFGIMQVFAGLVVCML